MDRFAELKAFSLVAGSGGFSSAARQLGVATSSVTRLVDALEQRLGTPLLNRSTRKVTLTDSGQAYFERALHILAQLDAADDAAAAGRGEPRGILRVTAPVTFCTLYIAPLLGELQRRFPLLELDLYLSDAVSNMVDDAIDVAIRIGAGDQQPNLVARRLAGHERLICASAAYLQQHGTPEVPADLLRHNCLQFAYGNPRRGWRLQRNEDNQDIEEIPVRGTLTVNNSEVLRRAALDGVGLAMLPDWLVRHDLRSGALVRVLGQYQVNPGAMDVGLYAMYQTNRRGSLKVKAFVDLLAEYLSAEIQD
jgi:DNA-binding transcriptional LysR family regulator